MDELFFLPREHAAVSRHKLPVVRKMPHTKNVPKLNEGAAAREQQRAAAAVAAAPAPAPVPHHDAPALEVGRDSLPSGVSLKLEEEGEAEEGEEGEEGPRRDGTALGPAQVSVFGPHAALNTVASPGPDHDAPDAGGTGGSAGTLVKEEEETLGQLRDRQALALAHGPVRVDAHIKVEDNTSGDDKGGDREGQEEEGPGGEGGLVLLAGGGARPGAGGRRGTRGSTSPENPCGQGGSGEAGTRRRRNRRRLA